MPHLLLVLQGVVTAVICPANAFLLVLSWGFQYGS